MRYKINSTGEIILADLEFVEMHHPKDFTEVTTIDNTAGVTNSVPWSKKDFLLKFTPDEYSTIKVAASTNSNVDYYWTLFNISDEVLKTDPVTVKGINALELSGLIAVGRAKEILK